MLHHGSDRSDEITETTLILEIKPDPIARRGERERAVEVRLALALKDLLRRYGLKCTIVRVPTDQELWFAADWE